MGKYSKEELKNLGKDKIKPKQTAQEYFNLVMPSLKKTLGK